MRRDTRDAYDSARAYRYGRNVGMRDFMFRIDFSGRQLIQDSVRRRCIRVVTDQVFF